MLTPPSAPCDVDEDRLRRALDAGDIRLLLPLLVQLTGDRRWLSDRYRPTPIRGMLVDHGGLSDEVRQEICDALHTAVMKWATGAAAPAMPTPTGTELHELLEFCTGDPVPDGYAEMHAQDMGFTQRPQQERVGDRAPAFTVVIIGAGLGGLLTALRLKEAGIAHVVLEKAGRTGGTWRDNRYPGAGVDVPSHLYSFSFFRSDWSQHFASRDEVAAYIDEFYAASDLEDSVRFGVEVTGARWSDESCTWTVRTRDADGVESALTAGLVISAVGIFGHPNEPEMTGRDRFAGEVFHSARWPADFDPSGKRIALVGTGASAMQIVPAIVDQVAHLDIYQRSAQWVSPMPTYGEAIDPDVRWLLENVPYYYEWTRFRLAWVFSDRLYPALQIDPDWARPDSVNATNERHRKFLLGYMREKLAGHEDLLEKALPQYPPYGKRMLLDNGWFDALTRPHVDLMTSGVLELTERGVVDEDGVERPADAVVLSTGFQVQRYLLPMRVQGRSGLDLREHWEDDNARAFLGVAAPPGFPNLFFVYGPNTNGIGGSYMLLAETQLDYIMQVISRMITDGLAAVEAKRSRFDAYNVEVDAAHDGLIWRHPGVSTFFRNQRGRVVVNSPWTVQGYWQRLQQADLSDYELTRVDDRAVRSAG